MPNLKKRVPKEAGSAVGRISAEIQQSRPFDSLAREMAVTLLRTGDVLRHAVEHALRPFGASQEQFNVLHILRGAGEEGLPTLDIAQRMVSRSPNITRLVDKMVAKGLAERHTVAHDRRVVRITNTPEGLALLARLDEAIDVLLSRLGALEPGVMKTLVKHLDAVRGRLAVPTARERAAKAKRS